METSEVLEDLERRIDSGISYLESLHKEYERRYGSVEESGRLKGKVESLKLVKDYLRDYK